MAIAPIVLVPPGTASIKLAPFKAPVFTDAKIPMGGVITSIVLESLSTAAQTNVPFTIGHSFKQGDITPTDGLEGLQLNVNSTHPNGSVRHAIISWVMSILQAGEKRSVPLVRKAGVAVSAPLVAPVSTVLELSINGAVFTASIDGAKPEIYFNGVFAQDTLFRGVPFKDAAGLNHPDLTAEFSIRSYAGTAQQRVDATVEHTKAYSATVDVTYDAKLIVAGEVKYSLAGLVHYPCARWRKIVWFGAEPQLHILHNTAYLIDSKAVANYDQSVVMVEPTLASYYKSLNPVAPAVSNFGPMKTGRFMAAMPTTGGRPDIGLAPDSYAAYILSMDKRAKDMMLASADMGGSWSGHRRDDSNGEAKGYPLDVIHFPYSTLLASTSDSKNPKTGGTEKFPLLASSSKLTADTSHQPAFAYIPYLVTGDFYYLEELQFWANFNLYNMNPYYRQYDKGVLSSEQLRGQGWALRNQFEAAAITPDDHPSKASFQYIVEQNMKYYNTTYTDCVDPIGTKNTWWNKLGTITNGYSVSYVLGGAANGANGTAPWMDDFFTQAVGHGSELGFTEATRLLKWKSIFQLGRMTAPGYCWIDAVVYELRLRETATSPWYETLAECHAKTFSPALVGLACNSPERLAVINSTLTVKQKPNEMTGYPTASAGYPANYQPALAMCTDVTGEDGMKAWSLFAARDAKTIYTDSPQFAIVPRVTTQVVPPPVVIVPPVVVTPPPLPPVVVITDPAVEIINPEFAGATGLTVLISAGIKTKPFLNLSGDGSGVIRIADKWFVKGTKYSCTVIDSNDYTISTIFPIKAN